METLTISHFPYYDFEDRHMAYTLGSAFYGIYFLVSFPVYYALDEPGNTPLEGTGLRGVALSVLSRSSQRGRREPSTTSMKHTVIYLNLVATND